MLPVTQTEDHSDAATGNPMRHGIPRRAALVLGGASVLGVVAACGGSNSASETTTAQTSGTSGGTPPPAGAAGTTGARAESTPVGGEAAAGSEPAPAGDPIASVAEVQAAGVLVTGQVLLAAVDGSVVAHTAICTHQQCTIAARGTEVQCPCHGSQYDPATGAVRRGPALTALAPVAVAVANGQVYLA